MNDEILMFLEKEYKDWCLQLQKDAYGDQKFPSEFCKYRTQLFKDLIEKRKNELIKITKENVLKKLTKEEIIILGL